MNKLFKTIVVQILPDKQTVKLLEEQGKESARWMNKVFHKLYADKRNGKWTKYGPGPEAHSKIWGDMVEVMDEDKNTARPVYRVNEYGFYRFIDKETYFKYAKDRVESYLDAQELQKLATKVAVAWQNFINGTIRPKKTKRRIEIRKNGKTEKINKNIKGVTNLPLFNPISILYVSTDKMKFTETGFIINSKKMSINSVSSDDKFKERIDSIRNNEKKHTSIEIKKVKDSNGIWKWYAHLPISIEVPDSIKQPNKVMGIDVGMRNIMTTAVIDNVNVLPKADRISGNSLIHKLERIQSRVRGLSSKRDKGDSSTRKTLKRLKGKRARMQETIIKQLSVDLLDSAVEEGVEGVAIEDLSSLRIKKKKGNPKNKKSSKRTRRLISSWAKGKAKSFLGYKSKEKGLNLKEVYPSGTSITCPVCGNKDKENRKSQSEFICTKIECGFKGNADEVASINIARRGYAYWHSLKWASRSTPAAGATSEDTGSNVSGESLNPQSKQTDGVVLSPEMVLQPGKPREVDKGNFIVTPPRMVRSETISSQKIFPEGGKQNIYKDGESSTDVTTPHPVGSRTDSRIEEKEEGKENSMSKMGGTRK